MSGTEPRRFLIATAISHYPNAPAELEWDRPGLVEARRKVVELFTGELGYTHVSDLGLNPGKQQLLRELREFCRAPDRRTDDVVAVYVAGHGEVLDNGDYVLLTADTEPDDLYDALLPGTLARKILAGTKVRRLLLMLDTCFSGQGGNELLATMARLKNDWREGESGLAVVTSAQPRELAQTGAFPDLLTEAVTSLATAGYSPPLLALDAVVNATRTNPKRPDFQHIGLEIIGLTGEIPPFLPNTKHSSGLSHTDMALQQAAEWDEQDKRRDVEFRTRLLRRAMGHSDPSRVGWWFSGRHQALNDIAEWLGDPTAEACPALVVTGAPGSGKTAVLGLLAAVSDPEYRRTVPLASIGLHHTQLPPAQAIGTTVYAQSLTDQQIVRAVCAALRLPPTDAVADLLNHLGARPEPDRPHVILIDGLDEAATPTTLCGQVLRPLMELAAPHLRLLLGTRPHLFAPLGLHPDGHIDLDSPLYADPDAVLVYTVRNLLDAHPDSPYLHCSNAVRMGVADAVAAAAGNCFLVARITAGTLAATPELPDPRDPVWLRSLPRAAADAMHRDLHQRFGEDAGRILDLLRPLAYAQGQGLPWEDIWAPLAAELAGRPYTNQDLYQLRRDAGAYVVEAVEDGRSVYRLYHESMAEYVRKGQDPERGAAGVHDSAAAGGSVRRRWFARLGAGPPVRPAAPGDACRRCRTAGHPAGRHRVPSPRRLRDAHAASAGCGKRRGPAQHRGVPLLPARAPASRRGGTPAGACGGGGAVQRAASRRGAQREGSQAGVEADGGVRGAVVEQSAECAYRAYGVGGGAGMHGGERQADSRHRLGGPDRTDVGPDHGRPRRQPHGRAHRSDRGGGVHLLGRPTGRRHRLSGRVGTAVGPRHVPGDRGADVWSLQQDPRGGVPGTGRSPGRCHGWLGPHTAGVGPGDGSGRRQAGDGHRSGEHACVCRAERQAGRRHRFDGLVGSLGPDHPSTPEATGSRSRFRLVQGGDVHGAERPTGRHQR
ncbi:hypothetical protein QF034_002339 [Streptomyces africanus]|uniref:Caspase domain-containing protein n=1 Tax=Streptomyces africanus TaxID=231024 RepID=A0ABU0QL50_9ACTN|nr:AAA family ATPase [Streptomyces africanus]MDQ0748108.1 hypothetical protein [Streptomyces africanus]